jgi:hypothetical protein
MGRSFSQAEVFPLIARVIEDHSRCSPEYMTHRGIVAAIMQDPEARLTLDRLPKQRSLYWWASTMVAWFSQKITVAQSRWANDFERTKIRGKWAYRSRQVAPHGPGEAPASGFPKRSPRAQR